ncbi:hypothetical protein BX600DRAFT_430665 [Xylariales sp. PMI_506]|nr:hypothetical protein BX600DRAFT_430665 [Xylariales sp. PMI_506]
MSATKSTTPKVQGTLDLDLSKAFPNLVYNENAHSSPLKTGVMTAPPTPPAIADQDAMLDSPVKPKRRKDRKTRKMEVDAAKIEAESLAGVLTAAERRKLKADGRKEKRRENRRKGRLLHHHETLQTGAAPTEDSTLLCVASKNTPEIVDVESSVTEMEGLVDSINREDAPSDQLDEKAGSKEDVVEGSPVAEAVSEVDALHNGTPELNADSKETASQPEEPISSAEIMSENGNVGRKYWLRSRNATRR